MPDACVYCAINKQRNGHVRTRAWSSNMYAQEMRQGEERGVGDSAGKIQSSAAGCPDDR